MKLLFSLVLILGLIVITHQDISGPKGCDCSKCGTNSNKLNPIVGKKHQDEVRGKSSCNLCEHRREILRKEREKQMRLQQCPFELLGSTSLKGKTSEEIFDELREAVVPSQNGFFDMMRDIVRTMHVTSVQDLKEAKAKEAKELAKKKQAAREAAKRKKEKMESRRDDVVSLNNPVNPKITVVLKQTPCGQVVAPSEPEKLDVPLSKRLPKDVNGEFYNSPKKYFELQAIEPYIQEENYGYSENEPHGLQSLDNDYQPTQYYISEAELKELQENFRPNSTGFTEEEIRELQELKRDFEAGKFGISEDELDQLLALDNIPRDTENNFSTETVHNQSVNSEFQENPNSNLEKNIRDFESVNNNYQRVENVLSESEFDEISPINHPQNAMYIPSNILKEYHSASIDKPDNTRSNFKEFELSSSNNKNKLKESNALRVIEPNKLLFLNNNEQNTYYISQDKRNQYESARNENENVKAFERAQSNYQSNEQNSFNERDIKKLGNRYPYRATDNFKDNIRNFQPTKSNLKISEFVYPKKIELQPITNGLETNYENDGQMDNHPNKNNNRDFKEFMYSGQTIDSSLYQTTVVDIPTRQSFQTNIYNNLRPDGLEPIQNNYDAEDFKSYNKLTDSLILQRNTDTNKYGVFEKDINGLQSTQGRFQKQQFSTPQEEISITQPILINNQESSYDSFINEDSSSRGFQTQQNYIAQKDFTKHQLQKSVTLHEGYRGTITGSTEHQTASNTMLTEESHNLAQGQTYQPYFSNSQKDEQYAFKDDFNEYNKPIENSYEREHTVPPQKEVFRYQTIQSNTPSDKNSLFKQYSDTFQVLENRQEQFSLPKNEKGSTILQSPEYQLSTSQYSTPPNEFSKLQSAGPEKVTTFLEYVKYLQPVKNKYKTNQYNNNQIGLQTTPSYITTQNYDFIKKEVNKLKNMYNTENSFQENPSELQTPKSIFQEDNFEPTDYYSKLVEEMSRLQPFQSNTETDKYGNMNEEINEETENAFVTKDYTTVLQQLINDFLSVQSNDEDSKFRTTVFLEPKYQNDKYYTGIKEELEKSRQSDDDFTAMKYTASRTDTNELHSVENILESGQNRELENKWIESQLEKSLEQKLTAPENEFLNLYPIDYQDQVENEILDSNVKHKHVNPDLFDQLIAYNILATEPTLSEFTETTEKIDSDSSTESSLIKYVSDEEIKAMSRGRNLADDFDLDMNLVPTDVFVGSDEFRNKHTYNDHSVSSTVM